MSTDCQKLSVFDTWVLTEAVRIFDELAERDGCASVEFDLLRPIKSWIDDAGASTEPPADFDAMLQRFREYTEARKACDEQSKFYASEAAKLESLLVEQFGATGTQSLKRDGKTFYLAREFQVSAIPETRDKLIEACHALDLDEMITVQPQRLASYCREMLNDIDGKLPEEIAPLVRVHEQQRLRMRSS